MIIFFLFWTADRTWLTARRSWAWGLMGVVSTALNHEKWVSFNGAALEKQRKNYGYSIMHWNLIFGASLDFIWISYILCQMPNICQKPNQWRILLLTDGLFYQVFNTVGLCKFWEKDLRQESKTMAFCLQAGFWHLSQLGGLGFLNFASKKACAHSNKTYVFYLYAYQYLA